MDQELLNRLNQIEQKIDAIYKSAQSTRNYIKWTIIITAVLFFLPLIGMVFVIPVFLNTLSQSVNLGF